MKVIISASVTTPHISDLYIIQRHKRKVFATRAIHLIRFCSYLLFVCLPSSNEQKRLHFLFMLRFSSIFALFFLSLSLFRSTYTTIARIKISNLFQQIGKEFSFADRFLHDIENKDLQSNSERRYFFGTSIAICDVASTFALYVLLTNGAFRSCNDERWHQRKGKAKILRFRITFQALQY